MSETATYRVTVVTGTARGAGTDADVYITLIGDADSTPELVLDGASNDFERSATNTFQLHAIDVGTLQRIRIRHTNTGIGAGWLLDHVRIRNEGTGVEATFPCGRWLATDEDDGQTTRELTAA